MYRRKNRIGWYGFISDRQKHISLGECIDEDEAMKRLLQLIENGEHVPIESVVYFIQDESGPIKIGTTVILATRLAQIQSYNPRPVTVLGVIRGGVGLEARLHGRFAHLLIRNEWFRPGEELLAFIKENCVK